MQALGMGPPEPAAQPSANARDGGPSGVPSSTAAGAAGGAAAASRTTTAAATAGAPSSTDPDAAGGVSVPPPAAAPSAPASQPPATTADVPPPSAGTPLREALAAALGSAAQPPATLAAPLPAPPAEAGTPAITASALEQALAAAMVRLGVVSLVWGALMHVCFDGGACASALRLDTMYAAIGAFVAAIIGNRPGCLRRRPHNQTLVRHCLRQQRNPRLPPPSRRSRWTMKGKWRPWKPTSSQRLAQHRRWMCMLQSNVALLVARWVTVQGCCCGATQRFCV
jgi:hypothetical protein